MGSSRLATPGKLALRLMGALQLSKVFQDSAVADMTAPTVNASMSTATEEAPGSFQHPQFPWRAIG
jgi:hypothetical protein